MFLEDSVFQHLYPLDKWRKSLLNDHRELAKAAELWSNTSGEILFLAASHYDEFNFRSVPDGYYELTRVLAWWCDVGPYSIDPTPLYEALRYAEDIAGDSRVAVGDSRVDVKEELLANVLRFGEAYTQASSILNRMLYAAFEQVGEEPPKMIGVTPQFKSPLCPRCGNESRVTSTRESIRHIKCKNESCGYQWKSAKST